MKITDQMAASIAGGIVVLLLIVGCAQKADAGHTANAAKEEATMKMTSPAFEHQGKIPSQYTCDGKNISPPLKIESVPASAKSLVLIMDDPDIPDFVKQKFNIDVWDHWVVFNIPPSTTEISEGKNPIGILGKNTGGKKAYGGPCPPDREHRYFFKLYALNAVLSLPAGATKKQVEEAMQGHVLAKAELVGRYERK